MNKIRFKNCHHQLTLCILAWLVTLSYSIAQNAKTPLLERTVSISIEREPLYAALKKIGKAGNVNFSYKSSLFDEQELITVEYTNKTIRQILDDLFKGRIEYKERGKYIILIKAEKETSSSATVSGYVIDEATGQRLKNVSVYDPVTLSSAVTDSYGYFQIEIKNPTGDQVKLAINKNQYTDTLLVVPSRDRRLLNIPIKFNKEKMNVVADSVSNKLKRLWYTTKLATQQAINMENISDTMYRFHQVSFVPFIGTNGKLSGNVINDFSLNILGGYSLGNRKAELGGLLNATRGNVSGVQVAGLANGVLGKQDGIQLAGLINASADSANGIQVAGLVNVAFNYKRSIGVAGLANVSLEDSEGISVGGLANYTSGIRNGPEVGGLFNYTGENAGPAQLAGLFNFSGGNFRGAQIAGLFNVIGRDLHGVQLSGLFNISPHDVKGAQITSLVNVAKDVRGFQLGLINYSKRIKGVPVGLVSIVSKGYHKLELSADEIFYTNIAYRTGVPQFYNILSVGAKPDTFGQDSTFWTFGYGVGTAPRISKWLSLNLDITSNQLVKGKIEKINLLNKIYGGLDFHLTKNLSLIAGISLNGHLTKTDYEKYPNIFTDYQPSIIRERELNHDLHLKMWWGGKIGIRLF